LRVKEPETHIILHEYDYDDEISKETNIKMAQLVYGGAD
jgi:hypothetical protein